MPDIVAIVPRLHRLLALGIGVSLDDYGTGHASADRLESIPVTELKLDRSLIQGDSRQVMRALIVAVERARERGLRIVAEGIETQAHLTLARNLRCDRAQGYLLGAPMRIWDVDALLAADLDVGKGIHFARIVRRSTVAAHVDLRPDHRHPRREQDVDPWPRPQRWNVHIPAAGPDGFEDLLAELGDGLGEK